MEFEPTPTGTLIKGVLTTEMSGSLELGALLLKPFIAAMSRRGMQRMASVLEADYQAGRLPT